VKARTIHGDKPDAGVPLSRSFHDHLVTIMKSDAKNPEVQNRYDQALARDPRRPGPGFSFSGNEANPLFHNTGSGFVEIGATTGLSRTEDSRGFVLVDLDGDGAQDVVLHNSFRNPLVALLNRAAGEGRWLRLRLGGATSNRFGIGARVTVTSGGRRQVQDLACGTGYLSGNAPELHFGLGTAERADVTVRWPWGGVEHYRDLRANRIHTLSQGSTSPVRVEEPKRFAIDAPSPEPPRPEPDARALALGLKTLQGEPSPVEGPALMVLVRTGCHACIEEFKHMEEYGRRAKELGIRLAWVTLDRDGAQVEEEFRRNGAPQMPMRPGSAMEGLATPTVYLLTAGRVEKFTGRFAMQAAFAAAAPGKK
jgi:ASPIC/UnbV protein